MFCGVVNGSSSDHHAVCAPVSERYVSCFSFISVLLGLVVAWPDLHVPICGFHLANKIIRATEDTLPSAKLLTMGFHGFQRAVTAIS